jgi:hypothetical protein
VLVGLAHLDPSRIPTLRAQLLSGASGLYLAAADIAEGLASLSALEGDHPQAALLLGAAVVIRGTPLVADTQVARTQTLIGPGFDVDYHRGLSLSRPEALSLTGVQP